MHNNSASVVRSGAVGETRPSRRRRGRDASTLAILSVTDNQPDHEQLKTMLRDRWMMERVSSAVSVHAALRRRRFAVILWDSDCMGTGWQSFATDRGAGSRGSPALIVTSRTADASLWAEALNLGAWDVLAKPFEPQEVRRVLSMAVAHADSRVAACAAAGE